MTAIVGLVTESTVYLAGDRSVTVGEYNYYLLKAESKVTRYDCGVLIGGAGWYNATRTLSALRLERPTLPAVRAAIRERNYKDKDIDILAAIGRRLYHLDHEGLVVRSHAERLAIGCGGDAIEEDLQTSEGDPVERLNRAFKVAEDSVWGVKGGPDIVRLEKSA